MGGQVHSDGSWFFMETFQGKKKILISLQLQLKSPAHMQATDSLEGKGAVLN